MLKKGGARSTYNIEGKVRGIGNVGLAAEVPLDLGTYGEISRVDRDLSALEEIEALDLEGLLEVDAVLAVEAGGLDLCLTFDGDLDGLVVGEPDVEGGEGVHVLDGDVLADVDLLVLGGGGRGELEGGEGGVRLEVLEVHAAGEPVDVGVDGAVGGDGGVDLHAVAVRLGLEDVDALDVELSIVDLALGNLGHADKDAVDCALERT